MGTLVTNQQEAFSELFSGMEIYTETFGLPETFLTTDEIFMLFDTTNIANMSKVTVTANLPCSSTDEPRFKVAVGTLGNSTNIIDSSAQSLNYTGPLGSCTYSGTVKAADESITIQRVWLTPNNGTNIAHTFFGNLVTLTALLDDGNIASAPSGPCPLDNTDTIIYWDFEQSTGNLQNQALTSDPCFPNGEGSQWDATPSGGVIQNAAGKLGVSSWSFDGTDDYATVGSIGDWNWLHDGTTKYSAEFWSKRDGECSTSEPQIFSTAQASSVLIGASLFCGTDESLTFYISSGNGAGPVIDWTSSASWYSSSWAHYVFTYDPTLGSNQLTVYKDGSFVANDSDNAQSPSSSNSTITMNLMRSDQGTDRFVNGDLDGMMFYKGRILSSGDVSERYNSGSGIIPTN